VGFTTLLTVWSGPAEPDEPELMPELLPATPSPAPPAEGGELPPGGATSCAGVEPDLFIVNPTMPKTNPARAKTAKTRAGSLTMNPILAPQYDKFQFHSVAKPMRLKLSGLSYTRHWLARWA